MPLYVSFHQFKHLCSFSLSITVPIVIVSSSFSGYFMFSCLWTTEKQRQKYFPTSTNHLLITDWRKVKLLLSDNHLISLYSTPQLPSVLFHAQQASVLSVVWAPEELGMNFMFTIFPTEYVSDSSSQDFLLQFPRKSILSPLLRIILFLLILLFSCLSGSHCSCCLFPYLVIVFKMYTGSMDIKKVI